MRVKWNTMRGVLDVYVNEGNNALSAQAGFKKAYDAFEYFRAQGLCDRVALYYGNGGTGVDFHDEANPFASNAFFVYQLPPTRNRSFSYYICMQYSESGTFGDGGGSPGLIQGTQGNATANSGQVGVQMAIAVNADGTPADPWAGTSNFDGADTKGTPVWEAPVGGTLSVYPRSNNTGGAHVTNKENFCPIVNQGGGVTDYRYDFQCDGDFVHLFFDFNDADVQDYLIAGPYKLRDDLAEGANALPFVAVHTNGTLGGSGGAAVPVIGDLAGTAFQQGGVIYDHTVGLKSMSDLSKGASSTYGAALVDAGAGEMSGAPGFPIHISSEEAGTIGAVGRHYMERRCYVDAAQLFRNEVIPDIPPYTHRVYVASSGTIVWVEAFPWAGGLAPKATSTRDGRTV